MRIMYKSYCRYILPILGLYFCTLNLSAQERNLGIGSGIWGVFGDIHSNQHITNFSRLPGIPNCCPRYTHGMNEQFAGTIGFHLPLSSIFILRPSFTMWDGTLRYSEFTKGGIAGQIVDVEIGHSIENSIRSAGLELLFAQSLYSTLQACIGIRADYIYQSSFSQKEELIRPSTIGIWNNGSTIRNSYSGDLPDASNLAIAPIISLHWTFPANTAKTVLISPEFMATYNLIPTIKSYEWNVLALRLGCAITFIQSKNIDTVSLDTIIPMKRSIAEQTKVPCEVKMLGIDSIGKTNGIDSIIVKETYDNKLQPLLPYVFFEEGSFKIPSRYNSAKNPQSFMIDDLSQKSKLEIYSSILDIIGQRLQKKPNAHLTLTGCNANYGREKSDISLSRKRAESVQSYLNEKWGIDLNRFKIIARNLPMNASITKTGKVQDIQDSRQENRRVELYSDDATILEPVHIQDTITIIEPEKVHFVFSDTSLKSQGDKHIIVTLNNTVIYDENISENKSHWTMDLSMLSSMMQNDTASNYDIIITGNSLLSECSISHSIPIRKSMKIDKQNHDSSYSEYSLMLFPFNSSGLGEHNMTIIETIKKTLIPGSKIIVEGFTDRVGTSAYNKKLSFNRAKSVFKSLQLDMSKYSIEPDSDILGSGEQDVHVLPEGRLYWRTVNIYVKNPMVKP